MALIKCPECKKDVSNIAPTCPFCGYPVASGPTPSVQVSPQEKRSQQLRDQINQLNEQLHTFDMKANAVSDKFDVGAGCLWLVLVLGVVVVFFQAGGIFGVLLGRETIQKSWSLYIWIFWAIMLVFAIFSTVKSRERKRLIKRRDEIKMEIERLRNTGSQ